MHLFSVKTYVVQQVFQPKKHQLSKTVVYLCLNTNTMEQEGYIMTSTGVSGCGWTANTTQPVEVATVDGMKPYEGYTIDVKG